MSRNGHNSKAQLKAQRQDSGHNGTRLLTPEDVAGFTGLSVETLAQWRSQRRGIAFLKIARNCVRYRQSDLDAWVEARIVPIIQQQSHARRNYVRSLSQGE